MPTVVYKEARAKINLSLLVTGRKPDGYHTLDSIIFFVNFCDRLSFRIDKELSLEISGPFGSNAMALTESPVIPSQSLRTNIPERIPSWGPDLQPSSITQRSFCI